MSVYITDYVSKPDVERSVLSDNLTKEKDKAEVLLVWHQVVDESYLSQFPNLKGVVRYGVGYDAIDLDAIKERRLVFCNTPDYGTDEVSDTAIAMIMNIARGLSIYDQNCRYYEDGSWQENTIKSLKRTSNLTLGIIGAGRIGGSVLLKARAIGFNVQFYDPYQHRGYEKMLSALRKDNLNDLLKTSDIISIHTPLNEQTRHMVDVGFISNMKKGASFVNTARGELVESLDIFYEPLQSNKLFSIALDVLPTEPPEESQIINAWKTNADWISGRLIINPHTAYYSEESYYEMRRKAAENALRILENKLPHNIIVNN